MSQRERRLVNDAHYRALASVARTNQTFINPRYSAAEHYTSQPSPSHLDEALYSRQLELSAAGAHIPLPSRGYAEVQYTKEEDTFPYAQERGGGHRHDMELGGDDHRRGHIVDMGLLRHADSRANASMIINPPPSGISGMNGLGGISSIQDVAPRRFLPNQGEMHNAFLAQQQQHQQQQQLRQQEEETREMQQQEIAQLRQELEQQKALVNAEVAKRNAAEQKADSATKAQSLIAREKNEVEVDLRTVKKSLQGAMTEKVDKETQLQDFRARLNGAERTTATWRERLGQETARGTQIQGQLAAMRFTHQGLQERIHELQQELDAVVAEKNQLSQANAKLVEENRQLGKLAKTHEGAPPARRARSAVATKSATDDYPRPPSLANTHLSLHPSDPYSQAELGIAFG